MPVPRPAVRRRLRVLRRGPRRGPLPPARHRWRLFGPRLIRGATSRLRLVPLRRGRDRVLVVPARPGSWHPRRRGVIPPAGCVVLVAVLRLRALPGTGVRRAIAGVLPPFAVVHGCVSCPFRYRIAIPRTAQPRPMGAGGVALHGERFRPTFFPPHSGDRVPPVEVPAAWCRPGGLHNPVHRLCTSPAVLSTALSRDTSTGAFGGTGVPSVPCSYAVAPHPHGRSRAIGDHKVSYPGSVMGGGSGVPRSGGA